MRPKSDNFESTYYYPQFRLDAGYEWYAEAACRGQDTNIFFPERGESIRPAKAICFTCPVRMQCLDMALSFGISEGIWGGLSEKERRLERRGRRAVTRHYDTLDQSPTARRARAYRAKLKAEAEEAASRRIG